MTPPPIHIEPPEDMPIWLRLKLGFFLRKLRVTPSQAVIRGFSRTPRGFAFVDFVVPAPTLGVDDKYYSAILVKED